MIIKRIKAELLNPAAYNPRRALKAGDKEYEKLKRSIAEFGFVEPVVWNKRTGNVVAGHQRLTVLRDMGEAEVDCVVVDLDSAKEKALNIALNKIQGEWDEDKLAAVLSDLDAQAFDVTLTGFDAAEVDELLNQFYSKEAIEDTFDEEKAVAEVKARVAVTKLGDLWRLGDHLLMCGDTTSPEDMARLMSGERAQVCVTSPPYGVGKEYERRGIEPWFALMKPAIKNTTRYADIVCWNIDDMHATGTQFIEPTSVYSANMFADNGFRPLWVRIWKKQGMNFGVAPYHLSTNKPAQQYEYISAFGGEEAAEPVSLEEYTFVSAFAAHNHKFVKRLTKEERRGWGYAGIWDIHTVTESKDHPAKFPVELPWRCIKMHSDNGGVVLDCFNGGFTTGIACEQTGRRYRGMEIVPEYCDVSVRRYIEFVGGSEKVFLIRDSIERPYTEVENGTG
jgi:DNA modification methylase